MVSVSDGATGPSEGGGNLPAAVERLNLVEQLNLLAELVEAITSVDPSAIGGALAAEASSRVWKATERLAAQRLGWLGEVEADGLWALDTMRTFAHWVGWRDGIGAAGAKREVHLAKTLRDFLPQTARAARQGEISSEHMRLMVQVAATSDARRAALAEPVPEPEPEAGTDPLADGDADPGSESQIGAAPESETAALLESSTRTGERVLIDLAKKVPLRDFRRVARRFAEVSDPEADERGFRESVEREHLDLSLTLGGYHVQGFLTEENGQLLQQALSAVLGVPKAGDSRSPAQRRATALAGLAQLVLDKGLVGQGCAVRPHLSVLVSWTEFQSLAHRTGADRDPHTGAVIDLEKVVTQPAAQWEDGTGPVPRAILERIAADCQITRIVFGPRGEILNVGRAERTFTGAKRRAVIARDQSCAWPGCHAPPNIGQIHHATRHWADGGDTSTDNAALLCWFHHKHVDSRRIAMRWDDGWEFLPPDPAARWTQNHGTTVPSHPRDRRIGLCSAASTLAS